MRTIAIQLILIQILMCLVSCDKDFVYDEDCITNKGGNTIDPWSPGKDTTTVDKPDTISGGFAISIDEWGDTIVKNITVQ